MSRWLMLSLALVVAVAASSAYLSANRAELFPEKVPVHWDINMQPDGFAQRDDVIQVFWLVPMVGAGVLTLLCALPWLSPAQFKVDGFRRVYDYIVFLVMAMLAYIHAVLLYGQSHGHVSSRWFMGGFFLFFGLIGNVLGKVRKNFWVGVRTPWTLASDVVWEKTHRLAAWLFVAAGIGGFAAVMCGVSPLWCFGGLIAAALVPVIYSLVLYKRLERAGQV
jgi:uncharacterized membrane protein